MQPYGMGSNIDHSIQIISLGAAGMRHINPESLVALYITYVTILCINNPYAIFYCI